MLGIRVTAQRIGALIRELPNSAVAFVLIASCVGLVLRLFAAGGELWLDEIWSLELAQQARSPWHILTEINQDNNHFLNTLCLWLLGDQMPGLVYRGGAVIAGTLSIPMAGMIARRCGAVESITTMTLFATSYLLVHYSSEARGYGFVILFALAGLESLVRLLETQQRRWLVAFTCCSAAGFLSHPLFVQFSLAMALGTFSLLLTATKSWWYAGKKTLQVHRFSALIAVVIYKVHWSRLTLGGGPSYEMGAKFAETLSLVLGGPSFGLGSILIAIQCFVAVGIGLRTLHQQRSVLAMPIALAIFIPFAQVIATRPPFLFVRYFLVAIVFGIFAIAIALGTLYRRDGAARWAYAGLLCGLLAANTLHTIELVQRGRGNCRSALRYMAQASKSSSITISSDHDFGIGKLVAHFGPSAAPDRRFVYVAGQQWTAAGPQWLVFHEEAENPPSGLRTSIIIEGHAFHLTRIFDCAPLSGWRWLCYRQSPSATASNSVRSERK